MKNFTPSHIPNALVVLLHTFFLLGVCGVLPVCIYSAQNSHSRKREAKAVAGPDSSNLTHHELACTDLLARFFPDAKRVEIQATLTPLRGASSTLRESVLVEFAGVEKAIFSSTYPLESDDRVRLEWADGASQSDAKVVAVQFHEGRIAVAVQFANGQGVWVKRP